MSRNALVAILGMVVFLVVAGAFYLEIAASARATDRVWMVTKSVRAGDDLTQDNLQRTRVPRAGTDLDYYTDDLFKNRRRAAHAMSAGTIVFKNDVLDQEMALVNLTLRTPPALAHGQTIDVYVLIGSQTMIMGRGLIVDQVNGTNGTNASVWVKAADEPSWIALSASGATLFAARSAGVEVPTSRALTREDALSNLSGGTGAPGPIIVPSPSPSKKP
jgi:hypothetical protein